MVSDELADQFWLPEACASRVVRWIYPVGRSIRAVWIVAISCWHRVLRQCPSRSQGRRSGKFGRSPVAERRRCDRHRHRMGQFGALDLDRLKAIMAQPVIVDLRNIYPSEDMAAAGFVYESIGRLVARPSQ